MKLPTELVVTDATVTLSKVNVTIERGENPPPITSTLSSFGPELGAIEIAGVPLASPLLLLLGWVVAIEFLILLLLLRHC